MSRTTWLSRGKCVQQAKIYFCVNLGNRREPSRRDQPGGHPRNCHKWNRCCPSAHYRVHSASEASAGTRYDRERRHCGPRLGFQPERVLPLDADGDASCVRQLPHDYAGGVGGGDAEFGAQFGSRPYAWGHCGKYADLDSAETWVITMPSVVVGHPSVMLCLKFLVCTPGRLFPKDIFHRNVWFFLISLFRLAE